MSGTLLDYGAAVNPGRNPARLLEDKLVKLNDRFGRAMVQIGPAKVSAAYFVLERV